MKKTIIYSIAFSLALFLTGINKGFAHNGEPKLKHKRVVVNKPVKHVNFYRHGRSAVRSGHVWIEGHYRWDRRTRSYVWIDGRYVRQKKGKVWISGHWVRVRGGWVYQPGVWSVTARF